MIAFPGRQRLESHLSGISGVVGCWPMDESSGGLYRDIVRSNHAAVTNGRTLTQGPVGRPVASLAAGSNQYGLVGNVAALRPANVSLLAWVNPNASAADKGIAGVADVDFDGYNLRVHNGVLVWRAGDGAATVNNCGSGPTLATGGSAWRFVAGTADGANIRMFIDGALIGSVVAAAYPVGYGATVNFYLGQWDGNSARSWAGGLAFVTVVARAMSQAELGAIERIWRGA